jgi:hypothetical protein
MLRRQTWNAAGLIQDDPAGRPVAASDDSERVTDRQPDAKTQHERGSLGYLSWLSAIDPPDLCTSHHQTAWLNLSWSAGRRMI